MIQFYKLLILYFWSIFGNGKIIVSEDFIVSDDDEWQSDRSSPKPRRKRGKRRGGNDSGSDWEVEHKKTKKPAHKFGSGSESGSDWGSAKKKKVSFTFMLRSSMFKICFLCHQNIRK